MLKCPQAGVDAYHLAQTSPGRSSLGSSVLWGKLGGEARRSGLAGETGNLTKSLTVAFWQKWVDMAWRMTQLLLLALVAAAWGAPSGTPQARTDLLNVCMNAKHHKTKPGPEDKLHDQVRMEWGLGQGRGLTPKRGEVREMGRSALAGDGGSRVAEVILVDLSQEATRILG